MKAFVIGGGGREHALAWKLGQEGWEVLVAPGNGGMATEFETADVPVNDRMRMLELCQEFGPDLVVIGPEDPLIAGLADMFRENGFVTFGPGADAARLEGSKAFSKDLMKRGEVPTAEYQVFAHSAGAEEYIDSRFADGRQVAVKASGAALGKGVVVCETPEEAKAAARSMIDEGAHGQAGRTIVVEDRMMGREFSLLTLVSDEGIFSLPVAQDYKRIGDGDVGPNTGGMGTYSPVAWLDDGVVAETEERIVQPILGALKELGVSYRGVLFSGLMVEHGVPKCLEYNVRFGDPEIQSVVRRLGNGFGDALLAVAQGEAIPEVPVLDQAAVTVVAASGGYPGSYEKGVPISMGAMPKGVVVFHAGTKLVDGGLVTSGGRVLAVSAVGKDVASARALAYEGVGAVEFEGKVCRSDIASG